MRVFATSDVHVDYAANAAWIAALSRADFVDDILILAGDVTDSLLLLDSTLRALAARFRKVLFVPGNHELWVIREPQIKTSLDKFDEVARVVEMSGASMKPHAQEGLVIVPLLGWYDFSFGAPSQELNTAWMDFHACRWPKEFHATDITAHFLAMNPVLSDEVEQKVITFSHFLPRIDVMPQFIPPEKSMLYPVLGSTALDRQLRALNSTLHVYGHSHVNRRVEIDGVTYCNNAFGYPQETSIASKRLLCIHAQ